MVSAGGLDQTASAKRPHRAEQDSCSDYFGDKAGDQPDVLSIISDFKLSLVTYFMDDPATVNHFNSGTLFRTSPFIWATSIIRMWTRM